MAKMNKCIYCFLGAPKHLYNWLCLSVGWSVGNAFIRRSTRRTLLAYLALFFYFFLLFRLYFSSISIFNFLTNLPLIPLLSLRLCVQMTSCVYLDSSGYVYKWFKVSIWTPYVYHWLHDLRVFIWSLVVITDLSTRTQVTCVNDVFLSELRYALNFALP